jgi:hypothetical protein
MEGVVALYSAYDDSMQEDPADGAETQKAAVSFDTRPRHKVRFAVIKHAKAIWNALDDIRSTTKTDDDDDEEKEAESFEFPLPNIPDFLMEPMIKYMELAYQNAPIEPLTETERSARALFDWEIEFFDQYDLETCIRFILAGDYIEHEWLMDASTKHLARRIKEKNKRGVMDMFGFTREFTPEETALAKQMFPFINDTLLGTPA